MVDLAVCTGALNIIVGIIRRGGALPTVREVTLRQFYAMHPCVQIRMGFAKFHKYNALERGFGAALSLARKSFVYRTTRFVSNYN